MGLDGNRFHYEEYGSGPPLLLVHGSAAHPRALTGLAEALAAARRVITYDRRGFPESDAVPLPEHRSYLERSARDAEQLLRELGASRAVVVGWGYGAVIALALALRSPGSVSRVIAFEAPLHAREHLGLRLTGAALGAVGLGKVGLPRRGAERMLRRLFAYEDGGSAFDELDARVRKAMLTPSRAVLADMEAAGGEQPTSAELAGLEAPVDLVLGSRSARFLRQSMEHQKRVFPRARVVRIPGGDHALPLRAPERLSAAILELLA
ncbi:MAG: putative alpha/beta fold superfamily hydrolase [Labilithrix sp.]|nr:putative alpha/beta fold superfamily hydrolase [Labilithrix sp.]